MKYVLAEYADPGNYTASSKARDDVVRILKNEGAVYLPLFHAKSGHLNAALSMARSCVSLWGKIEKGDEIFVQYPYNPQIVNAVLIRMLSRAAGRKKARLCVIVHDINSFRYTAGQERGDRMAREALLLNRADLIVVHNPKMTELLRSCGCTAKMSSLGFFDYLYQGDFADAAYSAAPRVAVAGNLSAEKSGYLYDLPEMNVFFELYGVNYDERLQKSKNVTYHGAFSPDKLIENMAGTYGLVWDGPSRDTCAGSYGAYLRYNSPHKFSLYIAAGMPVIVWEGSALADTVEKLGIGITISKLDDIYDAAAKISMEEYEIMRRHTEEQSYFVRGGRKLKAAITCNRAAVCL